ncbi:hypothetical protein PISMIDRAFT_326911 [Pisolithus microcarpus 441]|uniref:Uncharacterized protein n=1 Tax=Pisolithus microcarpus 441 TaxID=765257 RepID=A0A0C9ZIS3_9AGAM|nr:hypothetical protein PISMIDRAFT_326911 [Pisolithus microcarpus 441]
MVPASWPFNPYYGLWRSLSLHRTARTDAPIGAGRSEDKGGMIGSRYQRRRHAAPVLTGIDPQNGVHHHTTSSSVIIDESTSTPHRVYRQVARHVNRPTNEGSELAMWPSNDRTPYETLHG